MKNVRGSLIQKLWATYHPHVPFYKHIFNTDNNLHLDHFALIDLPSEHSGIEYLKSLFHKIGFVYGGEGYLPEKQNPFNWLREKDYHTKLKGTTLPQIVIADFKLAELSPKIRSIVEKYAAYAKPLDKDKLNYYEEQIDKSNQAIISEFVNFLYENIIKKDWPAITLDEYNTVHKENELIAWVLVFGRIINHFGISIHLFNKYNNLSELNQFIIDNNIVKLNSAPQLIKGGEYCGIAQSSSDGLLTKIRLQDEEITTPNSFLEFVWRYPQLANPTFAGDYYADFIPQNANHVIESIYNPKAV